MSRALIVTGHRPIMHPFAAATEPFDWVIAADSGWGAARAAGWTPTHLVGDFDSIADNALEDATAIGAVVERHPTDKNDSDGALARDVATRLGASSVMWANGGGGRLDHQLIELALVSRRSEADVQAAIGSDLVYPVHGPGSITLAPRPGATISIVPMHGDANHVTTRGLRYSLNGEDLPAGTTRGLSNVATADGTCQVELAAGTVVVIVIDGALHAAAEAWARSQTTPINAEES